MMQQGNDQEQDRQTPPPQDGEKKLTFSEALEALKRMKEQEQARTQ